MELNITNYNLTAEQVALKQVAELPLDADFSLPDYLGEISQLIKCDAVPYLSSKQISGNTFTVEGETVITVIYLNRQGEIFSCNECLPFKKVFEGGAPFEDGFGVVMADCLVHTCRPVTERRISVKASVRLDATVTVTKKNSIITDIDNPLFEKLCGTAKATTSITNTQKILIIDEQLNLPTNMPFAKRVIRTDCEANITDRKIISGKAIIKGNLQVNILYCAENDELKKQNFNLPFSQIIDITELNEFCELEAKVSVIGMNLTPRGSGDGKIDSFMLIAKLEITAFARCNSEIPVIYDLYSTKYKTSTSVNEVPIAKILRQIEENFLCKKSVTLPEEDCTILESWCKISGINSRLEGNSATVSGNLIALMLYKNSEGRIGFFEKPIDFEYPIQFESDAVNPSCQADVKVLKCGANTVNGAEFELELLICATVYDFESMHLITDLEVEKEEVVRTNSAIVAYYADCGEKIWEISKAFSANKNRIMEINHLTEETVEFSKMLLIPLI